MQVPQEKR